MKKIIIIACILFVANINAQTEEWRKIVVPTNQNLNEICFIDNNIGFMCGDSGTILKTIDKGYHWQTINAPDTNDIVSIAFTDENIGAILSSVGINNNRFFVTTDGGTNWELKYVGNGGFCFPQIIKAHNNKIFIGGNGCFYGDAIAIYENDTTVMDTMLTGYNTINLIL